MQKKHLLCVIAVCALIMACSKITKANYEKVEVGMDYKEVIAILGDPGGCESNLGIKNCQWGSEDKGISIAFIADKVTVPSSKGL